MLLTEKKRPNLGTFFSENNLTFFWRHVQPLSWFLSEREIELDIPKRIDWVIVKARKKREWIGDCELCKVLQQSIDEKKLAYLLCERLGSHRSSGRGSEVPLKKKKKRLGSRMWNHSFERNDAFGMSCCVHDIYLILETCNDLK